MRPGRACAHPSMPAFSTTRASVNSFIGTCRLGARNEFNILATFSISCCRNLPSELSNIPPVVHAIETNFPCGLIGLLERRFERMTHSRDPEHASPAGHNFIAFAARSRVQHLHISNFRGFFEPANLLAISEFP